MSRVRITQVRSAIDRSLKQKRTLQALGLRKINGSVEHELNDTIQGMINKVSHLVEVSEVEAIEPTRTKTEAPVRAKAAPAAIAKQEEE